jgi:GT2 family glycosyltransferase
VPSPASVVAVVVTWNRLALLQESLAAVRGQTHAPVTIVVVDNASTDGTAELLDSSYADELGLDVTHLRENTGGAGGFAVGVERALVHHPDLVWLLDDDTVPTPTALEELVRAWAAYPGDVGTNRPAVLASKVVWTDGRDHPMNTPRRRPGASAAETAAAESVGAMPVRSASFV